MPVTPTGDLLTGVGCASMRSAANGNNSRLRNFGARLKTGSHNARGKNANTTVVAVARELSGFIWDIGRLAMSLALPCSTEAT